MFATTASKDVEAADYENNLEDTIQWPFPFHGNKMNGLLLCMKNWYPGFMKEVTENVFFVVLETMTVINVYTYYKYLEFLVEN